MDNRTAARTSYRAVLCAFEKWFPTSTIALGIEEQFSTLLHRIQLFNANIRRRGFESRQTLSIGRVFGSTGVTQARSNFMTRPGSWPAMPIAPEARHCWVDLTPTQQNSLEDEAAAIAQRNNEDCVRAYDELMAEYQSELQTWQEFFARQTAPVPNTETECAPLYLRAWAQLQALDAGLNYWGYLPDYIPPWSFEHLHALALQLAERASAIEQRIIATFQAEDALNKEILLADQGVEQATLAQQIAQANVELKDAENALANLKAEQAVKQALTGFALGVVGFMGAAAAGGPVGMIGAFSRTVSAMQQMDHAADVLMATQAVSNTSMGVALLQRDAADLDRQHALDYQNLIQNQNVDAEALEELLFSLEGLRLRYLDQGHRIGWLAQRALSWETRQSHSALLPDYSGNMGAGGMTAGERLAADLLSLRADWVAGTVRRLQEAKLTLRLSEISPGALRSLRSDGTAAFTILQRALDEKVPGTMLHRLSDVSVSFIGRVTSSGPIGSLSHLGLSWVRVPNEAGFVGSTNTSEDWPQTILQEAVPRWVRRQLVSGPASVLLSEFEPRADRVVLTAPQGMLKPMEHQGPEGIWTLTLPRQGNDFSFGDIEDVEFTFTFVCVYDAELHSWQDRALTTQGLANTLSSQTRFSDASDAAESLGAFINPQGGWGTDVRYLVWDAGPGDHQRWEARRALVNVLARLRPGLSARVMCDSDPVGKVFTTDTNGNAFTVRGITTSEPLPTPNSDLTAWVDGLTTGVAPDPVQRWVLKVAPGYGTNDDTGSAFLALDVHGAPVTAARGLLVAKSTHVVAGSASYAGAWFNLEFASTVVLDGATVTLCVRKTSTSWRAIRFTPSGANYVLQWLEGQESSSVNLGTSRTLALPRNEPIRVRARAYGSTYELYLDEVRVLSAIEPGSPATAAATGAIGIRVTAASSGEEPEFDDVVVTELTGLGVAASQLLSEPFDEVTLPTTWTFAGTWEHGATPPRKLDLTSLAEGELLLEYTHEANLGVHTAAYAYTQSAGTRLTAGDALALRADSKWTVSAWVKLSTAGHVLGRMDGSAIGWAWRLLGDGTMQFIYIAPGTATWYVQTTSGAVAYNTWTHIVVANRQGTTVHRDNVEIYINGVKQVVTRSGSATGNPGVPNWSLSQMLLPSGTDFAGQVAQVETWEGLALTQQQIEWLSAEKKPRDARALEKAALTHLWAMGDHPNDTKDLLHDWVGDSHFTPYDGTTRSIAKQTVSTLGVARVRSLYVDKAYVDAGKVAPLYAGTAWSISYWAKQSSGSGGSYVLGRWDHRTAGQSENGWWAKHSGDKVTFVVQDATATSPNRWELTTAALSPGFDGNWKHVAITHDPALSGTNAERVRIYVNGVNVTPTPSISGALSVSSAKAKYTNSNFTIGSVYVGTGHDPFQGSLDEVAYWPVALSSTQVTALYSSGNPTDLSNTAGVPTPSWWYTCGDFVGDGTQTIRDAIRLQSGTVKRTSIVDEPVFEYQVETSP